MIRPVAAAVLLATAAAALVACSEVESAQRRICESLLPVIEPAGTRITIRRVEPDPRRVGNIRVLYHVERADPDGGSPDVEDAVVACAFGGTGFEAGKTELVGVETREGILSDIRLALLKRFWLADPVAVAEAMQDVERGPEARRTAPVTVAPETGFLLQQIVNAAAPSALYALVALAYSLVYGLIGRINLAFGDLVMLGAYGALIGVLIGLAGGVGAVGLLLPLAAAVAAASAALWSGVMGKVVFRPLRIRGAQPLLVATIGASIAIQEFVARVQGVKERWLPPILAETHLLAGGPFEVVVTSMQLVVIGGTALTVLAVLVSVARSRFGRAWRAVADDEGMAAMVGIDPGRVLVATFALSGMLAGLAGVIMTVHYGGTGFALGTVIGLKALVAAVLGGIGSLGGAVAGGLAIGLGETLWSAYLPIEWRDAAVLSLLAVVLILKPEGLFGTRAALEERDRP